MDSLRRRNDARGDGCGRRRHLPGRAVPAALARYSDFLLRTNTPPKLGEHSHEATDAQLGRRTQPKCVIRLCVYSALIAREHGVMPKRVRVVLGDSTWVSVPVRRANPSA